MFIDAERDTSDAIESDGLTLEQFTGFFHELLNQPAWRAQADKEMDYKDGNQLDSDILQKMALIGLPPAVEPLIGLAIESILGAEAKKRTDWRVVPDGDKDGQEVADAYNYKLNQAERKSRADRSCSDAYESQVSVGLGWVEVSRESDPFKYPYRCQFVHRNEVWWDWLAKCPMLSDARYLIRMKWVDKDIAKLMFADQADIIEQSVSGWNGMDAFMLDGGQSTGLYKAQNDERGWSIEEQQWRDVEHRKIRLFEVWYRTWEQALVLKMQDGRVVELDQDDPMHMLAISQGIQPQYATISRVHQAWFAGPHKLRDELSPYRHKHFPYVPFWGHREDRTGVPFGRIRGMMYMQDNINASISKIRWGLAATVTTRTEGAVLGDDEHFRQEIARPDADIVLDAAHMAQPGATFKVDRNFELNEQQYKMLNDARNAITKVGGISDEFQGNNNSATSGVQFNSQVEQSQQSLANIDDNFRESRAQVGDLLLSMIVQDSIGKQEDVLIDGGALKEDRVVTLNRPITDDSGIQYLTNDVERTMLKVVLDDVPSTSSYRNQQLASLSEAYKASPQEYQRIMMPHMLSLMDVPDKDAIIKAIKDADAQPSPEAQEMQRKMKELEIKQMMSDAQIKQIEANAVKTMTEAQYAAMQGGAQVASMPTIAPIADAIMMNAGYQPPNPGGVDPNFPQPEQIAVPTQPTNTNPMTPALPESPSLGANGGIETQRITDNLGATQ